MGRWICVWILRVASPPPNGCKPLKKPILPRVLKTFGEERFAKRIARAIVERNRIDPMTRTKALAEVVAAATPVKDKFKHPATRTFRAVRAFG